MRRKKELQEVHLYGCFWAVTVDGIALEIRDRGSGDEIPFGRGFSHESRTDLGTNQPPVQWVPSLSRGIKLAGV